MQNYVMSKKQDIARMRELETLLDYHSHKYYVDNNPEISDREFDALLSELQGLETQYPDEADKFGHGQLLEESQFIQCEVISGNFNPALTFFPCFRTTVPVYEQLHYLRCFLTKGLVDQLFFIFRGLDGIRMILDIVNNVRYAYG